MPAKVLYLPNEDLRVPPFLTLKSFNHVWKILGMKKPTFKVPFERRLTVGEAIKQGICWADGTPVTEGTVDWGYDSRNMEFMSRKGFGQCGVVVITKRTQEGVEYASHDSIIMNEGPIILRNPSDPTSAIPSDNYLGGFMRRQSLSMATIEMVGTIPYAHLRIQYRKNMRGFVWSTAGGYWGPGMTFEQAVQNEISTEIGGRILRIHNGPKANLDTPEIWLNRERYASGIFVPTVVAQRLDSVPPIETPHEDEEILKYRIAIPLMALDTTQFVDGFCELGMRAAINLYKRGKLY